MTPVLSIRPDPPQQGQRLKIHIDGASPPVDLELDWVPPGAGPAKLTTDFSGCADLVVPDAAMSLTISGGGATALATSILPA